MRVRFLMSEVLLYKMKDFDVFYLNLRPDASLGLSKRAEFVRERGLKEGLGRSRKVNVRIPGKGHSNSHGARPVHLIITMIKWIRTSRLSIRKCLSWQVGGGRRAPLARVPRLRLIDSCITQLKAQGPPRTCNESKEEEEEVVWASIWELRAPTGVPRS